jgi:serine phosphatase RsbU (regulator of sigma subunit)
MRAMQLVGRSAAALTLLEARPTFLARANKLLSESLDVQHTVDQFATLCVETGAAWCEIVMTEEYGSARAFAVGKPAPRHNGTAPLAVVTIPITARGKGIGTACLATGDTGRKFTSEDALLVEELVALAALAVDNSALYQRQCRAARELQRGLLPSRLPICPGVRLAARFVPGTRDVEVGGDWYDVIALGDGRLGLVIGDVVGRGIPAARIMGELRSVLRTYALDGCAPAVVADRLNRLAHTFAEHEIATLVYMVFDPHQRTARFVRAGHMPPVVLHGGRHPQVLNEPCSLPLGVLTDTGFVEGAITLEPDSTLLLYTDGLVERRNRGLEQGIALLAEVTAAGPDDVEGLCDYVLKTMMGPTHGSDDIALLVLKATG